MILISSREVDEWGGAATEVGARGFIPKAKLTADDGGAPDVSLARRPLWVLGAAGLLVAAIETPLIATADFAPDRELWIVLNWVIGVGFVLVGIYAWMRRPENLVGALMVATGFAWFISVLGHTEPAPFFTVGALFDSLFVGVAIHLFLSFPSGRLESKVDRWAVGAVYAAVTVGYIPYIVFWDPRRWAAPAAPTTSC